MKFGDILEFSSQSIGTLKEYHAYHDDRWSPNYNYLHVSYYLLEDARLS